MGSAALYRFFRRKLSAGCFPGLGCKANQI